MHVEYHLQLASIVKSHHAPHYSIIITLNSAGYFYTLPIAALLRHRCHFILICIIWYWPMLYATELYHVILTCIMWYWLMLYDTVRYYMISTRVIRYRLVLYDAYLHGLACIVWYWRDSGPSHWIEPVHRGRLLDFSRDRQINIPPHCEACFSFQLTGRCACGTPLWLGLEPRTSLLSDYCSTTDPAILTVIACKLSLTSSFALRLHVVSPTIVLLGTYRSRVLVPLVLSVSSELSLLIITYNHGQRNTEIFTVLFNLRRTI